MEDGPPPQVFKLMSLFSHKLIAHYPRGSQAPVVADRGVSVAGREGGEVTIPRVTIVLTTASY